MVAVAAGALTLGAVAGAYLFVTGLQSKVERLTAERETLTTALRIQTENVSVLQRNIGEWDDAQRELVGKIGELSRLTAEASGETRRLYATFTKHDLGALADAKPGLVERRINDGSARSNRMLECASGDRDACRDLGGEARPEAAAPSP